MSTDETRSVVEAYMVDLDPNRLARGAELWDMRSSHHLYGRDEVGAWLRRLSARSLATPRLVSNHITVGEAAAAVEWELRGFHRGSAAFDEFFRLTELHPLAVD